MGQIRQAFGLTVAQFATVLAVHPGTVSRWEASGVHPVTIDGIAANVLAAADARLQAAGRKTPSDFEKIGAEIATGLLVGGAIVALAALLGWLAKNSAR